jgi:hypothetical protein
MHRRHWNASEALECIRGIGMHRRHWNASEALECIRGIGMHRKSTEADRADRASGEYKVSEAVKRSELVRTH